MKINKYQNIKRTSAFPFLFNITLLLINVGNATAKEERRAERNSVE